jgi:hypothetical protein
VEAVTKKGDKERAALDRLADFLVEDIFDVSDEEILAEFEASHGSLAVNTAEMRELFDRSLLISSKKRLAAAKAGLIESRRRRAAVKSGSLDVQKARTYLRAIVDAPGLPQKITLAARKESELSDSDIFGLIEDLQELGILSSKDFK